jgi:hypothetical protein
MKILLSAKTVFYWLLLQNRPNTRGHLRRRRMHLDSYTCDLCILQKEETLRHLFFRCSSAKLYLQRIGVIVPSWLKPDRATCHIKRAMRQPFAMEIIIIMCWSIWKERNACILDDQPPTVDRCLITFKKEIRHVYKRMKKACAPDLLSRIQNLGPSFVCFCRSFVIFPFILFLFTVLYLVSNI